MIKISEHPLVSEESVSQIARPGWEERCHLAEVLRLKGWMFSQQCDAAGAEQNYLASLDVARQQQAKSWELRTAYRNQSFALVAEPGQAVGST